METDDAEAKEQSAVETTEYKGNVDEGDEGSGPSAAIQAVDITEDWRNGAVTIDSAGSFFLSSDIETSGTLAIAAPANETVVLDLRGHSVKVRGVVTCAIDVGASQGTVIVEDSLYKDGEPGARLEVQANKAASAICGIQASFAALDAHSAPRVEIRDVGIDVNLNTLDAAAPTGALDAYGLYFGYEDAAVEQGKAGVELRNVRIAANVHEDIVVDDESRRALEENGEALLTGGRSGIACAVFAAKEGVQLDGSFEAELASAGGVADLYGAVDNAFSFAGGFEPSDALRVYAAGNAEGSVIGTAQTEDEARDVASAIVDATDHGLVAQAAGRAVVLSSEARTALGGSASSPDGARLSAGGLAAQGESGEGDGADADADADADEEGSGEAAGRWADSALAAAAVPLKSGLRALALAAQADGDPEEDASPIELNTENLSEQYVLAAGKTYYLSGDLTVKSNLIIKEDAKKGRAVLDLRGHKLTMLSPNSESTSVSTIPSIYVGESTSANATSHTTLSIVSTGGARGAIEFVDCGNLTVRNTGSLVLDNVDVSKTFTRDNEVTGFDTPVVNVGAMGAKNMRQDDRRAVEVSISNSVISLDLSSQVNTPKNVGATSVSGVKFNTLALKLASLSNCEVIVKAPGSGGVSDSSGMHYNAAYAVLVQSGLNATATSGNLATPTYQGNGEITIDGCTLSATSPQGAAYGVCQLFDDPAAKNTSNKSEAKWTFPASHSQKVTFSGQKTSITVSGALGEDGVAGNKPNTPITLNAPLEFTAAGNAPHSAAIASDGTEGSFVVGPSFSGSGLPVYMGTDDSSANKSGTIAAKYSADVPEAGRAGLAACLVSAIDLPVKIAAGDEGLMFEVDKENAGAYIKHSNGSEGDYFSTANAAFGAMANGDTAVLLKDAGALSFPDTAGEREAADASQLSYTVDLNGHSASSFECSSAANVTLRSGAGAVKALQGSTFVVSGSNRYTAAIVQNGTGTLTVEGIPVSIQGSTTRSSRGISVGNGQVVVTGASIAVTANANASYGVYCEGSGSARLADGSVSVKQYGPYNAQGAGQASNGTGSIELEGCSVAVEGIGFLYGARIDKGDLSLSAGAAVSVLAQDGIEGKDAYAVSAAAGTVSIDSSSCAVAFEDEVEPYAASGCLSVGAETKLSLAGACAFTSPGAAHLQGLAATATVSAGFALSGQSDPALVVSSPSGIAGDALASLPEDAEDDGAVPAAVLFAAAAGSYYDGWELKASIDGKSLVYHTDDAAEVGGQTYRTLAAAVNAADGANSTVTVLRDGLVSPALSVNGKDIALDLNGHTVTITGSTSAVELTGGSAWTVRDSASSDKGALTLEASSYGFNLHDTCSLVLDGCSVHVVGGDSGDLVGVHAENGSVTLSGATLDVEKSGMGASGAVVGIDVPFKAGESPGSVTVDAASTVKAANDGGFAQAGSILNRVQSGSSGSDYFYQGATITRLDIDEDSDLYKSITAQFRKSASFDGSSTLNRLPTGSSVYSAQIYYVAPMELDDGTAVWAFSNPVTDEGTVVVDDDGNETVRDVAGLIDTVYPAAIYVQSTYQVPPDAVGIRASASATVGSLGSADVTISGTVEARSIAGSAYAALVGNGGGLWTLNGSTLVAESTGARSFKANTEASPNLTDALGLSESLGVRFYPKEGSNPGPAKEVVTATPQAAAVKACSGKELVKLSGEVRLSASAALDDALSAVDILADQVVVDTSFAVAAGSAPISIASSDGKAVSSPEKFAVGEEGYNVTDAQRKLFADATGAHSPVIDDGGLVWDDGTFTVRFFDAFGQVVSAEEGVTGEQLVQLPDYESMARDATPAASYLFKGWSTRANAKPTDSDLIDVDGGTVTFLTFSVPEDADSNVVDYYPVYEVVANTVNVSFRVAFDSGGNKLKTVTAGIPVGSTISEAIGNGTLTLPARASYVTGEGDDAVRQVFVGWRGSVNGTTATYDEGELLDVPLYRDASLTAYYVAVSAQQYLARFKVGPALYAYAAEVGKAPSWTAASGSDALPVKASASGVNYVARGWIDKYVKDSNNGWEYDESTDTPISQPLPASSSDVIYTARFAAETTSVRLNFMYWMKQDGGYAWNQEPVAVVCDYGTNPFHLMDDKMDTEFVIDGEVYKFLGWTTRYNDKKPMWGEGGTVGTADDMTTVTRSSGGVSSSAKFWAVYGVEEQTADVTFMAKDASGRYAAYATASAVPAKATIGEAFGATGVEAPKNLSDELVFRGWSNVQDADRGLSEDVATVNIGRYIDASTGAATLYAAYGTPDYYDIALKANGGIGEDYETFAYKGGLIDFDDSFENPKMLGMYLDGWNTEADGSGQEFDVKRDVPSGDTNLYAQYKPLAANVAEGASVDLSSSFVNAGAAEGSSGVLLEFDEVDSPAAALVASLSSYDTIAKSYNVRLGFVNEDLPTYVTKDFGSIKVSVPMPDECKGHDAVVRWIGADGQAVSVEFEASDGALSAQAASDGSLEFEIKSYALDATGGNIAVLSRLTPSEQKLAANKTQALEALQGAYDSYNEADYVGFDTTILAEYTKGVNAITGATTPEAAVAAANAAIAAMADVPTKRGLETEKATALKRLADAYAGYTKSDYTEDGWAELGAAYQAARDAINEAATASEATDAANAGITAMSAVKVAEGGASSGTVSTAKSTGVPSTTGSGVSAGASSGGVPSTTSSASLVPSTTASGGDPMKMLGASIEPVTNDLMEKMQLAADVGLYVSALDEGGPADAAGIREGDVITKIDGKYVQSLDDLNHALEGKAAGDEVTLTIDRNGEVADYTVTLGGGTASDLAALGLLGADDVLSGDGLTGATGRDANSGADAGMAGWAQQNPGLLAVGLAVLVAAVAALVWWLMRRRNAGIASADDGEPGLGGGPSDAATPAIQF